MAEKEEILKEAFKRIKEDILNIGIEISDLKLELDTIKQENSLLVDIITQLRLSSLSTDKPTDRQTNPQIGYSAPSQANNPILPNIKFPSNHVIPAQIPTHNPEFSAIPTHNPTQNIIPTDNLPLYALKSQDKPFSSGNEGVPTDKPTDRQTDQQTHQHVNSPAKIAEIPTMTQNFKSEIQLKLDVDKDKNYLIKASEILANLDSIKKEIRLKFKRLTLQEMNVFSSVYQLEEEGFEVDYPLLSNKLKLSESSIRDYIGKIQHKGIPINKEKFNNKRIILHISPDLKKIASLNTILQLRDL